MGNISGVNLFKLYCGGSLSHLPSLSHISEEKSWLHQCPEYNEPAPEYDDIYFYVSRIQGIYLFHVDMGPNSCVGGPFTHGWGYEKQTLCSKEPKHAPVSPEHASLAEYVWSSKTSNVIDSTSS